MMPHKLTITLADEVYRGLHERAGRDEIRHYVEDLVRSHVVQDRDLERAYREAAKDAQAEREALAWIEANVDDGLPSCVAARSTGSISTRLVVVKSGSDGRP